MAKKKTKKEKKTKTADVRSSQIGSNLVVVLSASVTAAIALFLAAGNNADATNLLQRVMDLFVNRLYMYLPPSKQEDYSLLVFHKWFRENGGWLHPNLTLTMIQGYGKGLEATGLIKSRQTILVIPEDLILSKQLALKRLFRNLEVNSQGGTDLRDMGDLEIIALALTVEECKHEQSFFAPYLDVLPKEDPPLLFTFNEPALALLQDEALARMARSTLSRLERLWKDVLAPAVTQLALLPRSSTEHQELDQSFASFSTFRRYYAIVSSHAMILNGVPYLVPMADMINHHHHDVDERTTSGKILLPSFADVHFRDSQSGAITVQADRRTVESHQLVEEYGPVDNSLYLVSFGFVPTDNPYHCVMLPYAHFSPLTSPELQQVLKRLDPSSFDDKSNNGASLCVRRDFGLLDEHLTGIYPALYSLDGEDLYVSQKNQCLTAAQQEDNQNNSENERPMLRAACHILASDSTRTRAWRNAVGRAAQIALNAARTTVDQDVALLERLVAVDIQQQKQQQQPNNRDSRHAILAIQFRIEEKNVLVALSRHDDEDY